MARENVISAKNLVCSYDLVESVSLINKLSFTVKSGDFVTVLGSSGSGKSTLTRILSGLLPISGGELTIFGLDMTEAANIRELRRKTGVIFSRPDRHFAAETVGDELAFGLKNFGTAKGEIQKKVAIALEKTGLSGYERLPLTLLSEEEKLWVAASCALAGQPELVIVDEALPTASLAETARLIELLRSDGRTLVLLTSHSDAAVSADKVILLNKGKKAAKGSPRKLLCDTQKLSEAGLTPPLSVRLYNDLKKAGAELPSCPLGLEELGKILCQYR